jgi:hypothetical protein
MPDLNPALADAISAAKARIHVGYPRWLRPWLARDVVAITLGRTIYVSSRAAERALDRLEPLIRHELAHVRQVNRHGLLLFLGRYVAEFLRHLWRVRSVSRAYAMISFEIEAVAAEGDDQGTGL